VAAGERKPLPSRRITNDVVRSSRRNAGTGNGVVGIVCGVREAASSQWKQTARLKNLVLTELNRDTPRTEHEQARAVQQRRAGSAGSGRHSPAQVIHNPPDPGGGGDGISSAWLQAGMAGVLIVGRRQVRR